MDKMAIYKEPIEGNSITIEPGRKLTITTPDKSQSLSYFSDANGMKWLYSRFLKDKKVLAILDVLRVLRGE